MTIAAAVERANLDELVRLVDGLAASRDWSGLEELRDRAREAVERGHQLWGVAHWCTYRLALDAPPKIAAAQLSEPSSPLLPGPITEILGVRHRWSDLRDHLPDGPARSIVAHECGLRGEPVDSAEVDPLVVDVPVRLGTWEGPYAPVGYGPDGGTFDPPSVPRLAPVELPHGAESVDDDGADALLELVRAWMAESAGRAEVRAVEGDAAAAIGTFGLRRARLGRVSPAEAMAWMAWAAASGGAYGTRRGSAAGRSSAWWTAAVLGGIDDAWPVDADTLGDVVGDLRWYVWSDLAPDTGWVVRLAVEDPLDGLAWALMAVDAR
ncbi:MAG: hypothetical protein AB1Z57_03100 [Acidimicrobiia bacterium]